MKVNLLIDGNHFIQRIFSVLETEQRLSQDELLGIWFNNLKSHIGDFKGKIERVVFAVDYGSWRNDMFDEIEYKGARKDKKKEQTEEEKEMYKLLFENYDEFQEQLIEHGIIVSKIPGLEGDDIIYIWKHMLMKEGENCIVYSGDSDLRQLSEYNGDSWTINAEYNPHHRQVIGPIGFKEEFLDNENIFDLQDSAIKSAINDLITKMGNYSELNTNHSVLNKIISGDKGDSVPAMYYKKVKNGYQRLGKRSVEKIIDQYEKYYGPIDTSVDITDDAFIKNIIKIIINVGSIEDKSYSELIAKFKRNTTMVHLDVSHYPSGILKALKENYNRYHGQKFKGLESLKDKKEEQFKRKLYNSDGIGDDYDPTNSDDFDIENLI